MPRRGGGSNPEFVSYVVGTNAVFVEITVPLRREMLRGFLQELQYLESHRARERLQNPQSSFLHFVTSQSYEILSERQSFAIVHYVLGDLKPSHRSSDSVHISRTAQRRSLRRSVRLCKVPSYRRAWSPGISLARRSCPRCTEMPAATSVTPSTSKGRGI